MANNVTAIELSASGIRLVVGYVQSGKVYVLQALQGERLPLDADGKISVKASEESIELLFQTAKTSLGDHFDFGPVIAVYPSDGFKGKEGEGSSLTVEKSNRITQLDYSNCVNIIQKEVKEDGEEEDPREELVQKLLEYKMYKYMSYELRDRELDAEKTFYKKPTVPDEVAKYEQPVNLDELLDGLTLVTLNQIFQQVMKRREDKVDPIRSKFQNIEQEEVSLPDKITFIRDYVKEKKKFSFRKLLESQHSKMHVIVSFLAILELMKMGEIMIEQKELFDDILIMEKPVRVSMQS